MFSSLQIFLFDYLNADMFKRLQRLCQRSPNCHYDTEFSGRVLRGDMAISALNYHSNNVYSLISNFYQIAVQVLKRKNVGISANNC